MFSKVWKPDTVFISVKEGGRGETITVKNEPDQYKERFQFFLLPGLNRWRKDRVVFGQTQTSLREEIKKIFFTQWENKNKKSGEKNSHKMSKQWNESCIEPFIPGRRRLQPLAGNNAHPEHVCITIHAICCMECLKRQPTENMTSRNYDKSFKT